MRPCHQEVRPQDPKQPAGAGDGQGLALRPAGAEAAWQSVEVDALCRLAAAGVRVPTPYNFRAGVLLIYFKAYFGQFAPDLPSGNYGREIWLRYEAGMLHPESVLDGYGGKNRRPGRSDAGHRRGE